MTQLEIRILYEIIDNYMNMEHKYVFFCIKSPNMLDIYVDQRFKLFHWLIKIFLNLIRNIKKNVTAVGYLKIHMYVYMYMYVK